MDMIQGASGDSEKEILKKLKKQELLAQLEKSKRENGQDKHGDYRAM
jgi:hypothetical protein